MKLLSQSDIKEIAEQMDCGMRCFCKTNTSKLLFLPADLEFEDDAAQFWQDEIEELKNQPLNYLEIERPESYDSFKMMREFANSAFVDKRFQEKLSNILEMRKTFANFKICIDTSDYREDWFTFKNNWMQNWVKDQLDGNLATDNAE
jgi:hypothetical protein